ncbi:hypothetical protein [sulfur-oxidizing endosymbiont of Gigantopelta aegis]|uniref:hypothetical protein n=1 Tax=sulfur-oxidizing endosymbiont of Gigantopelta aegis TaxID=2794934 RepID=UPI0018DBA957|nr:hypothetical protein [sulfur-oxidizing endosymbiont of Gigantopelta aegis]
MVVPYVFGIVFETIWQSKTEQQEQGRHPYLMFHAATLADKDNKAVLFPAQSGAGKSTLAALLAAKGWSFFTDELSIVVPDTKQVFSCPLPVCVKDGAVKYLVDCYPLIEKLKQYCRLDKKNVRYLPIKNAALSFDVGATLQAIVFPQYEQSIACELVVIDKTEALLRFLECGSSGRRMKEHELASVLKMLEALPCYYLKYSDINLAKLELEAVLF